jgi:hypothetical protein
VQPSFKTLNMNGEILDFTNADLLHQIFKPFIANILVLISDAGVQGRHDKIFLSGTLGYDLMFIIDNILSDDLLIKSNSSTPITYLHAEDTSRGAVYCGFTSKKINQIPYFLDDGKFSVKNGQVVGLEIPATLVEDDVDYIIGIGKLMNRKLGAIF